MFDFRFDDWQALSSNHYSDFKVRCDAEAEVLVEATSYVFIISIATLFWKVQFCTHL